MTQDIKPVMAYSSPFLNVQSLLSSARCHCTLFSCTFTVPSDPKTSWTTIVDIRCWEKCDFPPFFRLHYQNAVKMITFPSPPVSMLVFCDQQSWQILDFKISPQTTLNWGDRALLIGKFRYFPKILKNNGQDCRLKLLLPYSKSIKKTKATSLPY